MIAAKNTSIASLCAALFLCIVSVGSHAATFSAERGISFDQWVTWPSADRWNDADVLNNFPEWKRYIDDAELRALRSHGFTTIRMPIDPAIFLHNDDKERQTKLLDGVVEVIDHALRADLNVVVDLHTIPYEESTGAIGTNRILDDDLIFVRYKSLVAKIASTLSKFDAQSVALELINEPQYACDARDTAPLWQAQLTQLHSAARAANLDITLVLPGACYASAEGLEKLDPLAFDDENIIWTFHSYEPFILTHQSAGWVGEPVSAFQNLPYPPSELSKETAKALPGTNRRYIEDSLAGKVRSDAGWYIRNEFEQLGTDKALRARMEQPFTIAATWADKHGIDRNDIFLGEFGFIAQEYGNDFATKPEWRIAYLKDMIALADKYGFGWSIWSYGGAFGMAQTFGGEKMPGNLLEKLELGAGN